MKIETQAIHSGYGIDESSGDIAPPIHLSTTFERDADGDYSRGHVYIRNTNPNRNDLETRLAALEGGFDAAAFASGSVAMMSLLQALKPGDHVLAPDSLYFGVRLLIQDIFAVWGLQSAFVDMTDLSVVQAAMQPNTRLLIIETPSNPMIHITDIQATAAIAHAGGAYLVCDNTIATPMFQKPFAHGADFVVHSTTKYIGGHSDVMGGAIIAREDSPYWQRLRMIQKVGGAVPSPFDCWLLLRGLQTLPYRIRAQVENAAQIARFLDGHAKVERVLYPGLDSHEGHHIASKQMTGYGALLSFLVKGGQDEAMQLAACLNLIKRATSFGGTHSTIEHRASVEQGTTTPRNLLRLSVGLEHGDDLIADLEQALNN